jgi:malonyl-CoA/methylmalonyl-CoA synthetase
VRPARGQHGLGGEVEAAVPTGPLFPRLSEPDDAPALIVGGQMLTYADLSAAAAGLAHGLEGVDRVALWATPSVETCVGAVAALAAGATIVPVNPGSGTRELEHVVADSRPERLIAAPGDELPPALAHIERAEAKPAGPSEQLPDETAAEDPAIILYTSGTTGPPKGAVIPRRAIASNLDALAEVWGWTADDRLAHALPLFHAHGLVLGLLGPLRAGGAVEHVGRFSPRAIGAALDGGATMVFGVPTMYGRIAAGAEADPDLAAAFGKARVLASGSAPLPAALHGRIERLTGQRILERYGLTETLMNVAVGEGSPASPGYVGLPLPGVDVRLVNDDGTTLDATDDETMGEIVVRGPNLFLGYLNRPDATAEAHRDGWFLTGDMATRRSDGYIRIVGRRATDLIKSGGYKIGAGEIEAALLEHEGVADVAVAARPDADLGERVVAWVVRAPGTEATGDALTSHVAGLLASHKRPREVHFVDELPRNALGKVMKKRLGG